MEESSPAVQARPNLSWQRIGVACLFFANAAISVWTVGFYRFEWLPWACLGLSGLTISPAKKSDPLLTFLRKPRNIFASALLIVGIAGLGRALYLTYIKHFG